MGTENSWDDYPRQLALDNYKRLYSLEKQLVAKDAEIERLQQEIKDLEARLDGDRYG